MKYLRWCYLFTFFISSIGRQGWSIDFNMAPLEFSNRAGCASLSKLPTRSSFLFLDSFNAGKAAYALGLQQKGDPRKSAKMGTKLFRLWSTHLAVEIANKILDGSLPLLPVTSSSEDQKAKGMFPRYIEAITSCNGTDEFLSCHKMNNILADFWAKAHQKKRYPEIKGKIGCHVIKKFSAFQSTLKTTKMTKGALADIGFHSTEPEKYINSCFSFNHSDKDPRFSVIQLDVADMPSEKSWNQEIGFKFWHTLKLFLSWGWRYAPEYQHEFGNFRDIFASIAFEDSIFLVPNGCRSITPPRCDSTGLATDAMRAAKFLGQTHAAIMEIPPRPIDILFQGKAKSVNDDHLEIFKAESADLWYRNFKKELTDIRFEMISNFTASISKMQIISKLLSASELSSDILETLESSEDLDNNEIYLTCMEFTLAKNNLYQDIYNEILNLKEGGELDNLLMMNSSSLIPGFVNYLKELTPSMEKFCSKLDKRGELRNSNKGIYKSLKRWAYFITRPEDKGSYNFQCKKTQDHEACPQTMGKKYLTGSVNGKEEVLICKTPLECARIFLESLVITTSVKRYAQAFLPMTDVIQSPALFNNYTMPTACKMYDPFAMKKRAWKLFVSDLSTAILYGSTCGAFAFRMIEPSTKKISSFKEIVEDNISKYTPITKKNSALIELGANFDFLSSVPCRVSLSNSISGSISMPFFSGFSVGVCKGKSFQLSSDGENNSMLSPSVTGKTRKRCFRCGMHFEQWSSMLCKATRGATGPLIAGVGIFQGVLRLFSNLTNNPNILKVNTVSIDQVSSSFKDYGEIDKSCHRKLKRGVSCRK